MTVLNSQSFEEFATKWKEARLSIISVQGGYLNAEGEVECVARVPKSLQADVLMRIYEKSHSVGEKIRKGLGRAFTLSETIDVLSHSGVPCFKGLWKKESAAFSRYLYRGECPSIPALFCCDYWREAARGLVEGLSPEIEYSRHSSLGHGNTGCLDYVFVRPVNRELGLVPIAVRVALEPLRQAFFKRNISVRWEGFCEDTLFFHADHESHALDQEERVLLTEEISTETQRRFPQLKISGIQQNGCY